MLIICTWKNDSFSPKSEKITKIQCLKYTIYRSSLLSIYFVYFSKYFIHIKDASKFSIVDTRMIDIMIIIILDLHFCLRLAIKNISSFDREMGNSSLIHKNIFYEYIISDI